MRKVDQHRARQIDHRGREGVAKLLFKVEKCRAIGVERGADRGLGREDGEVVVGADHRPLDKQAVDARRVLDGVGEAASGFEIEAERGGAEVDVEIEQRGGLGEIAARDPRQRGGQHRGPRSAARADHRHGEMPVLGQGFGMARRG